MTSDTDARIMDLEVKLAFQEHTIAELDDVLRALVDRVEALERELEAVREEHRNAQAPFVNEKPPHY